MQSMIALCCRLLRVLFAIAKYEVPYNPDKYWKALNSEQFIVSSLVLESSTLECSVFNY